jgi:hypothetical protein
MDKKKSKKKTTGLTFCGGYVKKLGGKSYFMQNKFSFQHLDSNNMGYVFNNFYDRLSFQKWEFKNTEEPGVYYIKNLGSGLYLTSNETGALNAALLEETSYQKWGAIKSTEAETYVFRNIGNDFIIDCNISNIIFLNEMKEEQWNDCSPNVLFYIYPKKPTK